MKLAVGMDLGGTHLRAALVDTEQGKVLSRYQSPVASKQPDDVAKLGIAAIRAVDPNHARTTTGVGFAAMLGDSRVVQSAPNFGWQNVDFLQLLAPVGENQVQLFNDLNAAAVGEARWGAARDVSEVVMVAVGTGIGGGVVLGNRLYSGAHQLAGEVGHVKVIPGGRECGCGARGCVEAYASGSHLAARAREDLAKTSSLALELAGSLEALHVGHLNDAALQGDRYAAELLEHAGSLLGLVLGNLVTTLNPARLVMGGGVWRKTSELRRHTLGYFEKIVNVPSLTGFALVDGTLGDDAGVLGSALLAVTGRP